MSKKFVISLGIVLLLAIAFTSAAMASTTTTPNTTTTPPPATIAEQVGVPITHREPIQPIGNSPVLSVTLYRSGSSNAWRTNYIIYNINHGSATSGSDLYERQIWADNILYTNGTWRDACQDHRIGYEAYCETDYKNYGASQTIYSRSHHYFHLAGYVDNDFYTAQTLP
jgi:hypothetical protein